MKSLLNALKDGRLVELTSTNNLEVMKFLAHIMEAVPGTPRDTDVASGIVERFGENRESFSFGMGVACPHMRIHGDGELLCVAGWSPEGIDFDGPNKEKCHLVVMYLIPDTRRADYLKEISSLAKALQSGGGISCIASARDIHSVRHLLLDWIGAMIESTAPDARARMIKIEQKMAQSAADFSLFKQGGIPFTAVVFPDMRCTILCADQDFIGRMEASKEFAALLSTLDHFEHENLCVFTIRQSSFAMSRIMKDCVAFKLK